MGRPSPNIVACLTWCEHVDGVGAGHSVSGSNLICTRPRNPTSSPTHEGVGTAMGIGLGDKVGILVGNVPACVAPIDPTDRYVRRRKLLAIASPNLKNAQRSD